MFGRGIDVISNSVAGYAAVYSTFEQECPEFAENIPAYRTFAEENNIHLGATIVDPQGTGRGDRVPPTRRGLPSGQPRRSSRKTPR